MPSGASYSNPLTCWHDLGMAKQIEYEIDNTVRDSLKAVLGELPKEVTQIEILAAHIFSLVKDLGLSESAHIDPAEHERPVLPDRVVQLVSRYIPTDDDDHLRNVLYDAFVELADSSEVGKSLNRNRALGRRETLLLAQTAWNIEQNDRRPLLPLQSTPLLDIPEVRTGKDIARMSWTERSNLKDVPGRSSGNSFRKQVARLAVFVARYFVDEQGKFASDLDDAELHQSEDGRRTIRWEGELEHEREIQRDAVSRTLQTEQSASTLVGNFVEVGGAYALRHIDEEINRLWSDGDNRRIWLWGGPGVGKSYAARRVVQDALLQNRASEESLIIWVDDADANAVIYHLARAAERMPRVAVQTGSDVPDRDEELARSLLTALHTISIPWLIVFDDARAEDLSRRKLLPPGTNPHGRVLITTLEDPSHDPAGQKIVVEQFTEDEAQDYLQLRLPDSPATDRVALAMNTGHHPLVLSMAVSTIQAEKMTIEEWLVEFEKQDLDVAADQADRGGYARSLGATWRIALERASRGQADGVVERAAMVAAIQSPSGHPTWLWHDERVSEWVDGANTLPKSRARIHPGVRRLLEFGILSLTGSWSNGFIAIHQVAARAIRESVDPVQLSEAAEALAETWLRQITKSNERAQSAQVSDGARPLSTLAGLNSFTRDAVALMLDFSEQRPSAIQMQWDRDNLRDLAPILLRGGATGRIQLAQGDVTLGRYMQSLGRHDAAREHFTSAFDLFEDLLDKWSLDDEWRAQVLAALADLAIQLEQYDQAEELRRSAVQLRERISASTSSDAARSFHNLIALTDLHQALADEKRSLDALQRAEAAQFANMTGGANDSASMHEQLGYRLASQGLLKEALERLHQAAELHGQQPWAESLLPPIWRKIGLLYAQLGEWSEAEHWLRQGSAPTILIASVLLNQGFSDEAKLLISEAAKSVTVPRQYTEMRSILETLDEERQDELDYELMRIVRVAMDRERWSEAADLSEMRLSRLQNQQGSDPGEDPTRLGKAYFLCGRTSAQAGRPELAVAHLRNGVAIYDLVTQLNPDDSATRRTLVNGLCGLAMVHTSLGAMDDALEAASRAEQMLQQVEGSELSHFTDSFSALAGVYVSARAADKELAVRQRMVEIARERTHLNEPRSVIELASVLDGLTRNYGRREDWSAALHSASELVELRRQLLVLESELPDRQRELADALAWHGFVSFKNDDLVESDRYITMATETRRALLAQAPSDVQASVDLAHVLSLHAALLITSEQRLRALALMREAVNHLQLPAELYPAAHAPQQVFLLESLAHHLRLEGSASEADEISARALHLRGEFPDEIGGPFAAE